MAEIDDNELATLRASAKFLEDLSKLDGGTKEIQRLAKKINPKIRTEEDVAEEYAAPLKEEIKKLAEWKDGMENRIASYNKEEAWNSLKKERGYTEDGIKSLKEFSEKNGIANPKYAAAAWEKENPPAPVTSPYLGTAMLASDMLGNNEETMKRLSENPLKFEEDETRKFLSEKRAERA